MSGGATAAEVPTGNTFDKYGSSNPVVRRLMGGFHSTLDELWTKAAPSSVLDVGCGEGVLTLEWAERLGSGRIVGIDLEDPKLRAEWEKRDRPNLEFRAEEATRLSFSDDEFDLASAIEVLEHVPEPEATLSEMARVARCHLLVSVPREPLWRGLNMARGAYWRDLGNTPGHVNHWSKRGFVSLLSRYGTVEEARSPFPGPCCLSGSRSYGRGAAILSVGIGATGIITFAYFSLASYSLSEEEYGHITLLWSAVFITVSVLYRPVEQLLSRTIADRDARGVEGSEHLRIAAMIQLALGVLFAVVALLLRDPIENDLFGGSSTLYWILLVSVLAYAVSYFARGYLAGHRQFALYGGLVLIKARAHVACSRSPWRSGSRRANRPSLSEWRRPRSCRWPWCRWRWPAGWRRARTPRRIRTPRCWTPPRATAAREPEFTLAHGAGFAVAVLLIMVCEQTFLNAGPLLVKATEEDGGRSAGGSRSTCS